MGNKTIPDIFVEGARKGWNIGVGNIIPNVIMAFAVIHVLKITGLLVFIGKIFHPLMAIFGLPGEAATVLMAAWMANAGGVGVAVGLYNSQVINEQHAVILLPAIFLMGAQLQFMGRCLGTIGVSTKLYPVYFSISIINAAIAMIIMRIIIPFF